ncbi:MAG: pyridoxal phosphate-dependent aminotransferase [Desulfobacterales bacterium]|nr:pyridoxal phosphate-dependent aminotransferase [Desulfobacterales bacterium]
MTFSARFNWDISPNRLSRILAAKKTAGVPVLDLTESNPTRAGFDYDAPRILAALARPASMRYSPAPRGLVAAREAIADYYRCDGHNPDPAAFFLTASTSEAYAYLFKLLGDPGDEILIPRPSYPLLESLIGLEALQGVAYPLRYDPGRGWWIDLELLENSLSTRSRAVVVVNPNNPTGSYLKKDELVGLNRICRRHELALIVDEVFSDYATGPDPQRVASAVDNREVLTFALSGFSKVLGLPQLKLSWIHVGGPTIARGAAVERLEFIADTYLSVAAPIQHAAPILLAERARIQRQIMARTAENHRLLLEILAAKPYCRILLREGGWYGVAAIADGDSDEERACRLLETSDVYVHPGYFYDFPDDGHFVFSLLTPDAVFRKGLVRIAAGLT